MIIDGIQMLPGMAEIPRNQWYVIAWSHEVAAGRMLARDCCGDPVLLYRGEDGAPHAVFNRCPHRGMPLSSATSQVVGDTVMCGYHGIRFNSSGECVEVPSGGAIPSKMCVRSYTVVERWQWIWVWMGDPALADASLIPDHQELGLENTPLHSEPGLMLEVQSNYLMPLENLVDATHITYLHHGMIDSGNVATHPYEVVVEGQSVSTVRRFENEVLPPMLRAVMGLKGERVSRTLTLTAYSNHLCLIRQDFVETEVTDAEPGRINLVVALTPATANRTYQFALFSTSFENHHPGRFDDLRKLLMEDVVVLEEIQRLFERLGPAHTPEVSVRADEAGMRTRRIIAGMIRSERPVDVQA
jgi:phenylpropionate dioxygenase-like ring-hydroxylating dioxygenase large terminal subunit